MSFEEYFRGKGCVVTGAASGIGFALAEGLLRAGALVVMADRDTETLGSAAGQLGAHNSSMHTMPVDVAKEEQVQRMVEESASLHGRLDFLFNNAGIGGTKPIEEATLQEWRRIIDVNLWSVIYGIHFALPIMRRQGGGHIVSTSSISGILPIPFQSLYNATKYAVTGLSETLRFELEEEGIHFSVACPGEVASRIWGTPIIGERVEAKIPDSAISAEEAAKLILEGVANKEGIIPLPESARKFWELYRASPETAGEVLRDMARRRRSTLQTKGTVF